MSLDRKGERGVGGFAEETVPKLIVLPIKGSLAQTPEERKEGIGYLGFPTTHQAAFAMIDPSMRDQARAVFPFLQGANVAFLKDFFDHASHVTLPAGQFICMEGNSCAVLPLALTGQARVYKIAASGREITLYRIPSGESCILTASCIMSQRIFPAFAVAETDMEALAVPAHLLPVWFDQHAVWRTYAFDLLSRRLSSVIELVEEVAFHHMDARLAAYLADAASADGRVERTHEVVAADLGTSREVVSRLLKDFEQDHLVALSRGVIEVRDRARLEKKG